MPMQRLDHFMAAANAAYYADNDPFQDFTTAPEITQVFGELLGAWCAITWNQLGRPTPFTLAECGPGRGTLMADALRATARVAPEFHAAHRLHLIETSPRLRAQQAARLHATWHDSIETLPEAPLILLANEFLDALPIRQFVRHTDGWTERHVEHGTFVERSCPPPPRGAAPGDILETCEAGEEFVAHLATRLATQGGAALLLDYGPAQTAPGDSLQALREGRPTNPLDHPGASDLTAHVDFQTLARVATAHGAQTHGPIRQGPFLASLGLFQRTGTLARTQGPARAGALMHAAQRLAEPDRMGALFKVLCLCQPNAPTPPGFET